MPSESTEEAAVTIPELSATLEGQSNASPSASVPGPKTDHTTPDSEELNTETHDEDGLRSISVRYFCETCVAMLMIFRLIVMMTTLQLGICLFRTIAPPPHAAISIQQHGN
jgi:hypothetical protein